MDGMRNSCPQAGSLSPWRNAKAPADSRIYAIGDIHGRSDLLLRLLTMIEADSASRPAVGRRILVFLGDYVDRGSDSRGVIDILLDRLPRDFQVAHLKGNHEKMLLDYLYDPDMADTWLGVGGLTTLRSYGVEWQGAEFTRDRLLARLPRRHRQFLEGLKTGTVMGDYFFCHAGVRPGVALEAQKEDDLLWIRRDFLEHQGDYGKVIVYGHTPRCEPEDRFSRIGVDTRAWQSGRLTAVALEDDVRRFLSTAAETGV
jgi:serine/threonine protein phosphatase 1